VLQKPYKGLVSDSLGKEQNDMGGCSKSLHVNSEILLPDANAKLAQPQSVALSLGEQFSTTHWKIAAEILPGELVDSRCGATT
jgi:hypothetical protein